jgi:hypothetical protein
MRSGIARRILWIVCVCLLAARVSAASNPVVMGDFDGDGQNDPATLVSRTALPAIQVRLSTTHDLTVLRLPAPASRLAVADLDGDQRDELIAGGATARIYVWTVRDRTFQPMSGHPAPAGISDRTPDGVNDGPDSSLAAVPTPEPVRAALTDIPRARAPALTKSRILPDGVDGLSRSFLFPLAPRPPPIP